MGLVDCEIVYAIMSKDEFLKFNNGSNHDKFMDAVNNKLNDNGVLKILYKISNVKSRIEFENLTEAEKCYHILKLLDYGIPIVQLSRISGLSYGKIQRIKKGAVGKVTNLTYNNKK